MRRIVPLLILAAFWAVPGAALAGGGGGRLCRGFGDGPLVLMLDNCFDAVAHFAPTGLDVEIANDGFQPHTFTAVDGSFDTGLVEPGATATLAFEAPGVFRVWCTLHGTAAGDGMAGVLVVGEPPPDELAAASIIGDLEGRLSAEQAALTEAVQATNERLSELAERSAEISRIVRAPATTVPAAASPVPSPAPAAAPQVIVVPRDWSGMALGVAAGVAALATLGVAAVASRRWRIPQGGSVVAHEGTPSAAGGRTAAALRQSGGGAGGTVAGSGAVP